MGNILKAKCSCGFSENVYFGAGKATFKTECNVPAINKITKKFSVENYFIEQNKKDFDFYNDPQMFKKTDGKTYGWNDVKIYEKNNYCPKCRQFTLNFEFVGYFD